jgi:hypothetical protein
LIRGIFPGLKPFGQIAGVLKFTKDARDPVLVTPDDHRQFSPIDLSLDLFALKPEIAFDEESIGATGDRSKGIHPARTGSLIQHGANNGPRGIAGQGEDLGANGSPLISRQCFETLLEQVPLGSRQLGNFGQPVTTSRTTPTTEPFGLRLAYRLHTGIYVGM